METRINSYTDRLKRQFHWIIPALAATLALWGAAFPALALSAVYYLGPSGSDGKPGTPNQPWATFNRAWDVLSAGDTLIVQNGTYNQTLRPSVSGQSGAPITIKAENDGQATLTGVDISQHNYLVFEGFRVVGSGDKEAVVISSPDGTPVTNQTNNITFRRVGVKGSGNLSNVSAFGIYRSRDILLEDIWVSGLGRYTLEIYGDTRITMRRAVVRWDGWTGTNDKPGDPKFCMGVYDTWGSLFENVILLDAAGGNTSGEKGGLYVAGNSNGPTAPYTNSQNNQFFGMIILNNVGYGLGVEGGSGGSNSGNTFTDTVVWGNSNFGVTTPRNANNTVMNHVTIGGNAEFGLYDGIGGQLAMTNSGVYDNAQDGLNTGPSPTYSNVFGNNPNYTRTSSGTNTISQNPNLKYLTRTEAGSPNQGTASDGKDRGATIIKQYQNGTLSTINLWPYPNEARIKNEMCALSDVSRGFCEKSSLTEYIWTYLGNPNPYPSTTDTTLPAPPTNLRVQ